MINIGLAEDNSFALKAIQDKLNAYPDLKLKVIGRNGRDLLEKMQDKVLDVILMDIEMPLMDGISATVQVKHLNPRIKVIALTTFDDDDKILEMIRAGASGYLLKEEPGQAVYKAICDSMEGGASMSASIALKVMNLLRNPLQGKAVEADFELTPRETEVLEQLKNGLTYQDIADNLFISYGTVRKHIENIYRKLNVDNKVNAVQTAVANRLIP